MRILTINCGSSTLKFELFEAAQCLREDRAPTLISDCESLIARAMAYSREHLADMPEIRDWTWSEE
jgi:xylulose-5-phosphate/fructose-6-phosphate phosphoketolase